MTNPLNHLLLHHRRFAFDPVRGDSLQLNTTALRLVKLMQQDPSISEASLLAVLTSEYEVTQHTAQRDLAEFLLTVNQRGWRVAS